MHFSATLPPVLTWVWKNFYGVTKTNKNNWTEFDHSWKCWGRVSTDEAVMQYSWWTDHRLLQTIHRFLCFWTVRDLTSGSVKSRLLDSTAPQSVTCFSICLSWIFIKCSVVLWRCFSLGWGASSRVRIYTPVCFFLIQSFFSLMCCQGENISAHRPSDSAVWALGA